MISAAPTGRSNLVWALVRKSVEKLQIWLKSYKNIGHLTWRTKYVLLCRRHKFTIKAQLCHAQDLHIVGGDVYLNSTNRTHCCVTTAITVMPARHSVMLYVNSLACYCFKARLHGSPRLINAVESTKENRVNSSFQRK